MYEKTINMLNIPEFIVKIQNICNMIDQNSVHISDSFFCYSSGKFNEM